MALGFPPITDRDVRAIALPLAVAAAALCCACTHQVEAAYRSQHRSAVTTVMTQEVENAVNAGSGDPEMRTLRQRLAANARDMDARITLARLYARRGYPDLALEHYRVAVMMDPDSLIATMELAKALRQMDQTQAALDVVQFYALKHPAASWEIPSLEGVLQDELGQFVPGEQAHRAALKLEPNRGSLHNNLGYNLLLQGKAEAAAAEFQAALKIDPRDEVAHNNLGAALAAQSPSTASGEQPAAQPAQSDSNPGPPKKVSKSEAKRNAARQAFADWQRNADPAVAHNNLAALMIEQGRWEEARAELRAALMAKPDFAPALANLRLVSDSDGKPATIPVRPRPVNFWKRFASTMGKLGGGDGSLSKPSSPASVPVQTSAQTGQSPAENLNAGNVAGAGAH